MGTDDPSRLQETPDRTDYFDRVLGAAGEWARYSDPKALAVLVFLGLGLTDLLSKSSKLQAAHEIGGFWAHTATIAFWLGLLLVVITVAAVSAAVFPRLGRDPFQSRKQAKSLFFFRGVAEYKSGSEYEAAVRSRTSQQLESEIAHQAYEVSKVASTKHKWTQRAYVAVLFFLTSWAISRLAFSLAV